jgi:hypothetical protein
MLGRRCYSKEKKMYTPVGKLKERSQPKPLLTKHKTDIYIQVPSLSVYRWKCMKEKEYIKFLPVPVVG